MTSNEKRIDAILTTTVTILMMLLVLGFTLAGIGLINL